MPWATIIHWTRSPAAWAQALDTCPALVRCLQDMESYNVRQLYGGHCERCRIFCDIYDFHEILDRLRAGVLMRKARVLWDGNDEPMEVLDVIDDDPSATDNTDSVVPVRTGPGQSERTVFLKDWTKSFTLCSEEYLRDLLQCTLSKDKSKLCTLQPKLSKDKEKRTKSQQSLSTLVAYG